jgi:hypothetical protein
MDAKRMDLETLGIKKIRFSNFLGISFGQGDVHKIINSCLI